jgi:hypothetical protein
MLKEALPEILRNAGRHGVLIIKNADDPNSWPPPQPIGKLSAIGK